MVQTAVVSPKRLLFVLTEIVGALILAAVVFWTIVTVGERWFYSQHANFLRLTAAAELSDADAYKASLTQIQRTRPENLISRIADYDSIHLTLARRDQNMYGATVRYTDPSGISSPKLDRAYSKLEAAKARALNSIPALSRILAANPTAPPRELERLNTTGTRDVSTNINAYITVASSFAQELRQQAAASEEQHYPYRDFLHTNFPALFP